MDPFKSNQRTTGKSQHSQQANPFARALAEAEKRSSSRAGSSSSSQPNNFENLNLDNANFGNNSLTQPSQFPGADQLNQPNSLFNAADHQRELEQQQEDLKKKQMREKLHKMINPVEQTGIFSAREEKRKKQLNKVREDLKALAEEIAKFYKEVDITLTQDVVSPGQTGVYHESFFEKLRQIIQMLRQRVSSARTWARQAKRKKRKRKFRYGLDFSNQEAKSAHDMLHHERNNAFGA